MDYPLMIGRDFMNTDNVKGNWKEIKGILSQEWGKISDNDIYRMKGTKDELLGTIQQKYGIGKEQAAKEIDEFLEKNGLTDASSVVQKAVDDLTAYAEEFTEEFTDYTDEAKEIIADYAAKNLFKTLGIAALVGAAVALLIRR